MGTTYEIAIDIYERMLAIFAHRAGVVAKPSATSLDDALAARAESLALPGQRAPADGSIPVLTSMIGHLHDGQYTNYYRPTAISNQAAMPLVERPSDLVADYASLWKDLDEDRRRFVSDKQTPKVREANLHALLQRYTWAMPAPLQVGDHNDATDVSLFDYARVSAALAVCLAHRDPVREEPALLVGGDISGVQDWLYTFGSSGAAKNLRGRSFYLQLLTEIIALYVLDELDLPVANLLYAGGGNFYLLAPTSLASKLETVRAAVCHKLLVMHGGDLYVAMGWDGVTTAQLEDGRIGDAWNAVNRVLNQVKTQRLTELDDESMARVLGTALSGTGKPEDTCLVCRRSISAGERGRLLDDGRQCDLCERFAELGNQLRTVEFLAISKVDTVAPQTVADWQQGLRQFGYDVQLLRHAQDAETPWQDHGTALVWIYYWKEKPAISDFPGWPGAERTVWSFRPLAQCKPELANGEIATFSELESEGIARWGVLRMDVDNLGALFRSGIPASNLSRVVGVSRLLRLFFEGYMPELAESYNQRGNPQLYLMYAGGDDLFVVGGWSHLPKLAHDIHSAFTSFACGNPKCTISGGISLALDDKYPLYQAARDAERAETRAKAGDKDALDFLGQTISWNDYERLYSRVRDLLNWLDEDSSRDSARLPRSFLMTLRAIDAEWRAWKRRETNAQKGVKPRYVHTNKILFLGPWQWHLVYSLKQAARRTHDENVISEIDAFTQSIVKGEIKMLGLAARWAELFTRRTGVHHG